MTETQIDMAFAKSIVEAVEQGCTYEDRCLAVRDLLAAHRTNRTDATPVAWMPIESAPKGVPTEDVGCRGESEWFLGKPSGKYPQSAPFVVICRRAWPQDDSWKDAGDTHYRPDYFSEWCPIETSHPPATDVAALVEAAKDVRDAIAHMATPTRVDPDKYFSEQVKAFGDAFGYGALMTTASAIWRQNLGDLQGGEFAVGPCVTTAANQLKRLSAALAPFTKGQNDE